ncbi:TetR/AcrR family transcriptional regulator [Amycolatopsis nigrescens]|uniref:TetR/AcrR family transcriptional regulator n=1 Tax=Amycolatopsis nigrescens TaxID=381445 RepID=UPI00036AF133|nr:TetR/AcrR family transcriptional regulator [Amycolatopsis nigrescens]
MTTDSEANLRADARRNRGQILLAAKRMFAELGADVPMEEIARAAGVGVGTLYRRFPDREALIRAVARDNFENVLIEARAAVAEEPTAWDALVRFLRQSRELQLSVQLAMVSPLARSVLEDDPMTNEFRYALVDELDGLVHQAQTDGALRDDIGTGDVAMLFMLLVRQMPSQYEDASRMAPDRCMAIMLDGIRARPGSPLLPFRPLTRTDIGV